MVGHQGPSSPPLDFYIHMHIILFLYGTLHSRAFGTSVLSCIIQAVVSMKHQTAKFTSNSPPDFPAIQ